MDTTPAGHPGPTFKPQLVPFVRVAVHGGAVDAATRVHECLAGFLPQSIDVIDYLSGADLNAGLYATADPAPLYAALPRAARVVVQGKAAMLRAELEGRLAPPLGTVKDEELTCLASAESGLPPGTVVLVRKSDLVTEQYAFPCIRADAHSGQIHTVIPRAPRTARAAGIHAEAGVLPVTQQIVGAAMAVTPFFPPPFGPAATGVLSFVNLMIGFFEDGAPPGPSPLQQAVNAIEDFVKDTNLGNLAGQLEAAAGEFANMTANETQDINNLSSIDGGISYLRDMLKSTWTPAVVTANRQLYEVLKTCNVTNFDRTLSLLVSGVTTELFMYHAQVAIGAVDASIQYRQQQVGAYTTATSMWTTVAGTAATDIGTPHDGAWTDDQVAAALGTSTSYFPMIEGWMAKARRGRLAQITGPTYFVPPDQHQDVHVAPVSGWTFLDASLGGDNGARDHMVQDSVTDCCGDPNAKENLVRQDMAEYASSVGKRVDDGFVPHRQVMASWQTYIANLIRLLPPGAPAAPTVGPPPTGGPAVPDGAWTAGIQVRYALLAKNTKGPSPASAWSSPLTVAETVGAGVSGIAGVAEADTMVVLRQFRAGGAGGAAGWSDSQAVSVLSPPFPPTYVDTNLGGDPW